MEIYKISTTKNHYKIITNHENIVIPRNEISSEIIPIIKSILEDNKNKQDIIIPQLLGQLQNTAQLFKITQNNKAKFSVPEFGEMIWRLEESYYFLYDLVKLFEIELPPNFFIQK